MPLRNFFKFLVPNSKKKIVVYILLLIAVMTTFPYLWAYYKYQSAIARAKAVGLFDVEAIIPPEVPAHQNASPDFVALGNKIKNAIKPISGGDSPPRPFHRATSMITSESGINQKDMPIIKEAHSAIAFVIDNIKQMVQKEHAQIQYPIQTEPLYNIYTPDFEIRLFCYYALMIDFLVKVNDQYFKEAYDTLIAMFRCNRLLQEQTYQGSHFFHYNYNALKIMISYQSPSQEQIKVLQKEFNHFDRYHESEQSIRYHFLSEFQLFEDFIHGNDQLIQRIQGTLSGSDLERLIGPMDFLVDENNDLEIQLSRYLLRFLIRINQANMMNYSSTVLEKINIPYYEIFNEADLSSVDWSNFYNQYHDDGIYSFYVRDYEIVFQDFMKVALALEVYLQKENHYPETLEELTPSFIDELPIDPFSGKPYQYKNNNGGYIIYSYSRNMKDDGGQLRRIVDKKRVEGDIVWEVKKTRGLILE